MKILIWFILAVFLGLAGCAPGYYTPGYQGRYQEGYYGPGVYPPWWQYDDPTIRPWFYEQ